MKMKDLCESERPRERMRALGAGSLGNGELIAILLRNGNSRESAVELSQRLLQSVDGKLSELFNMSLEQLLGFSGIGLCKAASVAAAFELGKRFLQENSGSDRGPLVSGRMVYELMIPLLKGLDHEESWVIWLNGKNRPTGKTRVNSGGMNSTVLDIRRINKMALERNASGLILVHNHPNGDPRPSDADIRQTNALHDSLEATGIKLVDHVIAADHYFYSFTEERVMKAISGQTPLSLP